MLKEKKEGFLYLFSDKEIRGIAIATFVLSVLLVSTEYLVHAAALDFVYGVAVISFVVFQYLFLFFLIYNIFRMFGAFSDKRKQRNDKACLWVIRGLTISVIVLADVLFFFTVIIPSILLIVTCFIIWCAMESFFLCKLAAELASFTRRRFFRFLAYLFFMIVFAAYLIISLWIAVGALEIGMPGSSGAGLGTTWFDWILTLVMLFFTFASMGERFLAAEHLDKLDFSKLSGKAGARIRSTVVFLLFAVIGFEMFVRGFTIIATFIPLPELGNVAYYGAKLVFFIPFAIGFMIAVIVKRIHKVPGKE